MAIELLPRVLGRSPWIEVCATLTAFTLGAFVVLEVSWTASPGTARTVGFAAAVISGIAAHVWCRRANARRDALDRNHDHLMRVAITTLVVGAVSFLARLATTELFVAPLACLAIGWVLLIGLVLVDRRRLAWVTAIRNGARADVRIADRALDAPDFFAGAKNDTTVVQVAAEAFRGEEMAIARIPSDARRPDLIARRQAVALLLAIPCIGVIVVAVTSTPALGLPPELAAFDSPGVEIKSIGRYPFLETEPDLAFWTINGADASYRVVAIERGGERRLLQGRALFLEGRCDAPPKREDPPVATTCARWASDVLTGKKLIISATRFEGNELTFDAVTSYPVPSRYCYAVEVDSGELSTKPCATHP